MNSNNNQLAIYLYKNGATRHTINSIGFIFKIFSIEQDLALRLTKQGFKFTHLSLQSSQLLRTMLHKATYFTLLKLKIIIIFKLMIFNKFNCFQRLLDHFFLLNRQLDSYKRIIVFYYWIFYIVLAYLIVLNFNLFLFEERWKFNIKLRFACDFFYLLIKFI